MGSLFLPLHRSTVLAALQVERQFIDDDEGVFEEKLE